MEGREPRNEVCEAPTDDRRQTKKDERLTVNALMCSRAAWPVVSPRRRRVNRKRCSA